MNWTRRRFLAVTPAVLLAQPPSSASDSSSTSFTEFTDRSERSITRGTTWLTKTFNRDGGCGVDIGTPTDISCTAAAGLALLSQGNSPISGPQNHLVRKTTNYLLDTVAHNRFRLDLNSQVRADLCAHADHHFAAMMLSQVLGQGREIDSVKNALAKTVRVIGRGQTGEGHWGEGRYPNLAAVTGWCSLRAAFFAGLKVQANAEKTAEYLIEQMNESQGSQDFFAVASGIRVLFAMQMEQHKVAQWAFREALDAATKHFPRFNRLGGEQYLAFHYINETMLMAGGNRWQKWFPIVREKLIDVQNSDGSWTGHSCIVSRTFCTACALLVLTSPNRYLPISQA